MKSRVRCIISGRVQGVFYRASAAEKARSLGLVGFVRNLSNGAVELVAEGERAFLERLIDWCRKGPPGAYIENIEVEWQDSRDEFTVFSIRG